MSEKNGRCCRVNDFISAEFMDRQTRRRAAVSYWGRHSWFRGHILREKVHEGSFKYLIHVHQIYSSSSLVSTTSYGRIAWCVAFLSASTETVSDELERVQKFKFNNVWGSVARDLGWRHVGDATAIKLRNNKSSTNHEKLYLETEVLTAGYST